MSITIDGAGSITGGTNVVLGTQQASTSGTAIDFTGIPSWARRVTVLFDSVSLSGTANILVQIGTSGGIETTGYSGSGRRSTSMTSATNGFIILTSAATQNPSGALLIQLMDAATYKWVANGTFGGTDSNNYDTAGVKSLSAALDRVRITTSNGTDTFDAGSINISYE